MKTRGTDLVQAVVFLTYTWIFLHILFPVMAGSRSQALPFGHHHIILFCVSYKYVCEKRQCLSNCRCCAHPFSKP
jgi:hypothetical protein